MNKKQILNEDVVIRNILDRIRGEKSKKFVIEPKIKNRALLLKTKIAQFYEQKLDIYTKERLVNLMKEMNDKIINFQKENNLPEGYTRGIDISSLSEEAKAAICKFKNEAKELLINKINYYKECLFKLDK